MAKKPVRKRTIDVKPAPQEAEDPGKAAFQLRVNRDVHQKLTETAEQLSISLNALLESMVVACADA